MSLRRSLALAAAFLTLGGPAIVQGEAYPLRPVTLTVPYPPGGATDVVARVIAQKLSERLGQPVVVDNKGGAGGNIGARQVAVAKPDGYSLLMGAVTAHSISMTLTPDTARYNLAKDFSPVTMVGEVPLIVILNPSVPANSLAEFIAMLKAKPATYTFASAGNGTTQHLGAELFMLMTGTNMTHVPYKGSGPAVTDLVGGQVQAGFETGPAVLSYIKSKRLKALAVAAKQRIPSLPDIPTAAEAGLPGFEVAATYGVLAPAGTPQPIIDQLNTQIREIIAMPDVKAKLEEQGVVPTPTTPAQTAQHVSSEIAKWAHVIKEANVKPE